MGARRDAIRDDPRAAALSHGFLPNQQRRLPKHRPRRANLSPSPYVESPYGPLHKGAHAQGQKYDSGNASTRVGL